MWRIIQILFGIIGMLFCIAFLILAVMILVILVDALLEIGWFDWLGSAFRDSLSSLWEYLVALF